MTAARLDEAVSSLQSKQMAQLMHYTAQNGQSGTKQNHNFRVVAFIMKSAQFAQNMQFSIILKCTFFAS